MILRHFLSISICYTLLITSTRADDFDCHVTIGENKYDLTSLAGEQSVSRERHTPPSDMVDTLRFDPCGELGRQDGVSELDQCHPGTRACLTKINKKDSENDRVVAVIAIAQTSTLDISYAAAVERKGISLVFHGDSYPSPSSPDQTIPQSLNLTVFCETEKSDPVFKSYDGSAVFVEWSAPAGCPFRGDEHPPADGQNGGGGESVGSGIGWFFLVLLLAVIAYFGLGAYYNYSTYGARGTDLIPHRDFWKEVPYMLSDVVSHLCSSIRPRKTASRGGYIAV